MTGGWAAPRQPFAGYRSHALGHTDAGRLLHISFTLRGNGRLIRVISAWTTFARGNPGCVQPPG